jgi:hypothetical protein
MLDVKLIAIAGFNTEKNLAINFYSLPDLYYVQSYHLPPLDTINTLISKGKQIS